MSVTGRTIGACLLVAGMSTAGFGALASEAGAATTAPADTIVNYNTYNITYNITINNYGTLTIYFTAGGFTAGEQVSETLHSAPVHVGNVKAGRKGTVSASVKVPKSLPVGEHELLLTGLKSGHVDAMSFYDSGARTATGGGAVPPGSSSPSTGGSVAPVTGGSSYAVAPVTGGGGVAGSGASAAAKVTGTLKSAGHAASSAALSPVGPTSGNAAIPSQIQGAATATGTHHSRKFNGSSSTEAAAGLAALLAVGGLGLAASRKRKQHSWSAT
jgi:hypothetical protein